MGWRSLFGLFAFFISFTWACGSYAQTLDDFVPPMNDGRHQQQFMPDNTLNRYDSVQQTNITQAEFGAILDKIESVYAPIFQSFGVKLVLERAWDDSTVNAYADQQGTNWIVHMYGGMARRSELNIAGFGLVACHEIGHHLGGYPKYSDSPWAANEGQSDLFSTHCGRKTLAGLGWPGLTASAMAKCDAAWGDQVSRELCYVNLSGGLALGKLLAVLGGEKVPAYETPDPSVVTKTSDKHPRAQCRTDTYLASAICTQLWPDNVIPKDDKATCNTRPKCWYAYADGEPVPNPDDPPAPPAPDPTGDDRLMSALSQLRQSYRVPLLRVEPQMVCAAKVLSDDLAATGRCSHITSDGQGVMARLRACGYKKGANQTLACSFATPEAAMQAWARDRYNLPVLVGRGWKAMGCASTDKKYVCILGTI